MKKIVVIILIVIVGIFLYNSNKNKWELSQPEVFEMLCKDTGGTIEDDYCICPIECDLDVICVPAPYFYEDYINGVFNGCE